MSLKVIALTGLIVFGGALKAYAADRTYALDGFNKIEVASGVDAKVVVGGDFAISADVLRGEIDHLSVEVRGDTLYLSREFGWRFLDPTGHDRFAVSVTMPRLTDAQSVADATIVIDGSVTAFAQVVQVRADDLQ